MEGRTGRKCLQLQHSLKKASGSASKSCPLEEFPVLGMGL